MNDEMLDRRFADLANRLTSLRSHFIGAICFWSMWTLSVPFWKAAILGVFATCFMVFQVENRLVTVVVLVVTLAAAATFTGISIQDVKQFALNFHAVS